ncbi:MAG: D-alanyl-D-alanine carboxypeptidase [uncultured bacterium]|nr:MAG: D-alanyl-D-alanine carboxypeptidase [uncultured bacterium]
MFAKIATIIVILIGQTGISASVKDTLASAFSAYVPKAESVIARADGEEKARLADEVVSSLAPLPGKISADSTIFVDAKSAIVLDAATKEVLFESNGNEKLPMASITKVMTCLLAIERGNLEDVVAIKQEDVIETGSDIDLRSGEEIRLDDLVKAALIKSANDAAQAVARQVGGDSKEAFVVMMNEKAKELGLRNTHYVNSHGFDEEGHYSSAYDIALLMSYAMENETFRTITRMKSHEAHVLNFDQRVIPISATNKLLIQDDSLIEGGKTGFTDEAGESLVTVAKNPNGHRIIIVLLDSPNANRFPETKRLIDWIYQKYDW